MNWLVMSLPTEPDHDLITWGTPGDGTGARLLLVLAIGVVAVLGAWVWANDRGEPAMHQVHMSDPSCTAD
jgi:hypothetical protein